jgi:hypothetical protein
VLGDDFWRTIGSDVLCDDLFFIFMIDPDEDVTIVEDHKMVLKNSPVLPM